MKWELEPRPDNTQPTEPTSSERYSATTRLPPYPERPEAFDFSLLWGTFWQWKFPLIALILAVTAAAWAASGLLSPRYEAAALIRLASDDLDVLGEGRRDPRGYIDPVALESQVRAVKGAEILKDAAQAVGLRYYNEFNGAFFPKFSLFGISAFFKSDEDRGRFGESEDETAVSTIVAALDRAAEVTQLGKSGIAQISILSQDPRLAALTVNEIGEGYIQSQLLRARARRLQGLDALVAQQAELQKRLRDVEEDIVQIREGNQLLFSEEPAAASSAFASLRQKLIESEAELAQAEHRYQSISEGKPGRGEANREIEFSPLIQALRQQRAALMIESTAISPDIGPLHPRMIAAKERVADVDRIIGEEVERLRSAVKNEAEFLRKKVEDLRAHLASMQGEIQGQTKSRIHLTGLLAQSEALRASIETLKGQIDRIEAEIALQQSSADFISRAVPPSKPSYPKRKMIAGGAFLGVTGLSVLFVVGLALTDRRIKSVKQINLMEASIGYPVLGVLPLHTALKLDPRTLDVDSLYMRSVAAITGALGINQNTLTTMGVYPLCPRDGGTSFSISLALCCSRMSSENAAYRAGFQRRDHSALRRRAGSQHARPGGRPIRSENVDLGDR